VSTAQASRRARTWLTLIRASPISTEHTPGRLIHVEYYQNALKVFSWSPAGDFSAPSIGQIAHFKDTRGSVIGGESISLRGSAVINQTAVCLTVRATSSIQP
jgi:hypothetical protein